MIIDNLLVATDSVAAPTFSSAGGGLTSPQYVTINCATTGATIYYTTDGTQPSPTHGTAIAPGSPVLVSDAITLSAMAYKNYYIPSPVNSISFTLTWNRPATIPYNNNVVVDGNLSEWSPSEFVPLDQPLDTWTSTVAELESDVPLGGAMYAARWGANNTLYVAVKVLDLDHYFLNDYDNWYTRDAIEVYVHTTGTGPTNYEATQADAQQYEVGIMASNQSQVWTAMGYGNSAANPPVTIPGPNNPIPANAGFQAAGSVSGNMIYYELAITPFQAFSLSGTGLVVSPLSAGMVVGLDVDDVACGLQGYNGTWAENMLPNKLTNYDSIATHLLVASGTIGSAKTSTDNATIYCSGVVTAVFSDCFYIESTDRTFGICVMGVNPGLTVGQLVNVGGTVQTLDSGERYIFALEPTVAGAGDITPLCMTNKSLGGGAYGTVTGQKQAGVTNGTGLNNIGLLVKTTGKITNSSGQPESFMIDDGSGVGVKVYGTVPSDKTYVQVTGISSCEVDSGNVDRVILATSIY